MTTETRIGSNLNLLETDLGDFKVRCGIIHGTNWNVVWDTLADPQELQNIPEMISGKNTVIIYSHADWDHVFGTAAFEGSYKLIIAHHTCRDRFLTELPDKLEHLGSKDPEKRSRIKLLPPDLTFSEKLILDLGDRNLELVHLPGHTKDSIVGYIPQEGILLAGDAVENPFPTITDCNLIDNWIENLEKMQLLDGLKMVIPAHGEPAGVDLLQKNITYLKNVKQGRSIEDTSALNEFYNSVHKTNMKLCGF